MTVHVLCLDPGFASFGYAELVLDRDGTPLVMRMGTLRTKRAKKRNGLNDDNTRRIKELSSLLGMMIADTDVVCSEAMSEGFSNAQTSKLMGMAWGVVVTHCQSNHKPLLEVSPQELRKRLGIEGAEKDGLREAMEKRFGKRALARLVTSLPKSQQQHAYDALAAGVACLDADEVVGLLSPKRDGRPRQTGVG